MTTEEKNLIRIINIMFATRAQEVSESLEEFDRMIAREDPWAFREFTGRWPTKADK